MESSISDLDFVESLLDRDKSREITISELMELLCQIVLALLIIFVMTNLLFMARAKASLDEAKGMIGQWRNKYHEIAAAPAGEQYKLRHEALLELQRQKLLNSLDKVEASAKQAYGITLFGVNGPDGSLDFVVDKLLVGIKITDDRFIKSCRLAKETLPFRDKLQRQWLSRVLTLEGMRLSKVISDSNSTTQTLETVMSEVVTKENEEWLFQEINRRVTNLTFNCRLLQRKALAKLQNHLRDNPEVLTGTKVYKLVQTYPSTSQDRQNELIEQISRMLYQYSKSIFSEQDVPLLNDV